MIVWLASYPRSGNTLLRTMLFRFFGIRTFSLYDDEADIGSDPNLAKLVGHVSHGMSQQDFVDRASAHAQPVFVKTHGFPAHDGSKAIYVVRDGRSALVSYFHYNREVLKVNVSLPQVVAGDTWGGNWSDSVREWVFSGRTNTLVLRFEDLTSREPESLERIANFLALPVPARSGIDFSELHGVNPAFFRRGSNVSNAGELDPETSALFWSLHGDAMVRLGYVDAVPP